MILFAVLVALASGNEPLICESRCEWIEKNHFGEVVWDQDSGKFRDRLIFVQLVFWDGAGREQCIAWRMAKEIKVVPDGRGVSCTFHDGDRLIRVRAKFFKETWTNFDVEMENREAYPPDQRRGIGTTCEQLYPSIRVMRHKEGM